MSLRCRSLTILTKLIHTGSFNSTSWSTINTSPSGVQKQNVKTHFKHSKALLRPEKQKPDSKKVILQVGLVYILEWTEKHKPIHPYTRKKQACVTGLQSSIEKQYPKTMKQK